jgi:hypothetical protein
MHRYVAVLGLLVVLLAGCDPTFGVADRVERRIELRRSGYLDPRYNPPLRCERFAAAVGSLTEALSRELKDDACPSWETCLAGYAEEVRRLAAGIDCPLSPNKEAILRDLIAVAASADAGRLSNEVALARIAQCAPVQFYMPWCVPPAPRE